MIKKKLYSFYDEYLYFAKYVFILFPFFIFFNSDVNIFINLIYSLIAIILLIAVLGVTLNLILLLLTIFEGTLNNGYHKKFLLFLAIPLIYDFISKKINCKYLFLLDESFFIMIILGIPAMIFIFIIVKMLTKLL